MMGTVPITAVPPAGLIAFDQLGAAQIPSAGVQGGSFSQLLVNGAQKVSDDAISADKLVRDFAINDSIPVHQVTYALEQAQLSLNLMMQVRNRLVEGYQQMMNMQL
jgi:flagellar hook-basal body complex protein FliE